MLTAPTPERVEVYPGTESTQVVALDSDDQVYAEIVVSATGDGRIRIDAVFSDDLSTMAVIDSSGKVIEIDNEDHEQIAPRIAAVLDILGETEQAGWGGCVFASVVTVVEIVAVSPWAIPHGIVAACECIPALVDGYEDIHCPWL